MSEEDEENEKSQNEKLMELTQDIPDEKIRDIIEKLIDEVDWLDQMQARILTILEHIKGLVKEETEDPVMKRMSISPKLEKLFDKMEENELYAAKELQAYFKAITKIIIHLKNYPQIPHEEPETEEEYESTTPQQTEYDKEEKYYDEPKESQKIREEPTPKKKNQEISEEDIKELERFEEERIKRTIPEMRPYVKQAIQAKKEKEGQPK